MDQPETKLQRKIVKELNKLPLTYFEKNHGSPMGKPKLDLTGSVYGICVHLEVKMPGKKPTDRQWGTIRYWRSRGAVADWVTSVDEAMDVINPILEKGDRIQDVLNSTSRAHLVGRKTD